MSSDSNSQPVPAVAPGRQILRCAIPGMLLVILCLLPFWNKAFTNDDPEFLHQANRH